MSRLRIAVPIALAVIAASAVHAEPFWEYTIPAGTEWREFEPDVAHGGGPWVVHWLNGAMVGEVSYHDRVGGAKWEERPVRDGKTHGTVRGWWPDGGSFKAVTYRGGVQHGLEAYWDDEGAMSSLYCYLHGQEVSYSMYSAVWEEDQANLPPPTLFGLPASWVGGRDPDDNLSDADRQRARQSELLLVNASKELNREKERITSGPNDVPPNPEQETLRLLNQARSAAMQIGDARKRAEQLIRVAELAIKARENIMHYAHIQQFVDLADSTLNQVPGAVRALDDPQMRSQFYTDLSETWRSLTKIALFQHPTVTPTYCDQKRAEYAQLAEQEKRRQPTGGAETSGGQTAGGATGGTSGGPGGAITLPQMGLSLTLPAGFTPMDVTAIPVMLRGPGQSVGMMIHMEQGAVDLQEFATIFMRDIGPAMGAGDLQEMARDAIAVGEGMPGLLCLARATINNTTADFAFLFFSANGRIYTFAYFAPTDAFNQHEPAFLSLLSSVTVGG